MLNILLAIITSLAYSTDVIFAKIALDNMPFFIFLFILAICYLILGTIIFFIYSKPIINYFSKIENKKYILLSILSVIIGTLLADIFMWTAIKYSSTKNLSTTISIIHTVPVFSLLLMWLIYKEKFNWQSILGTIIVIIGVCIIIIYK